MAKLYNLGAWTRCTCIYGMSLPSDLIHEFSLNIEGLLAGIARSSCMSVILLVFSKQCIP